MDNHTKKKQLQGQNQLVEKFLEEIYLKEP
jgi:hypothetical protein